MRLKDINWHESESEHTMPGEHYEGRVGDCPVGELVIDPKSVGKGQIIGTFTVKNSDMFDQVAVSAAIFAVKECPKANNSMPKVVPGDNEGLILQSNV